jgi:ABC-type uncharacterized transport system auxiliary subunit
MSVAARLVALGIALALFGAGCAPVLERKPIEKHRFLLQPPPPQPVSGPRAGVLRIGVVRTSPPFQNRGFVWRTGDQSYKSDFYNEFAAPPGTLLRDVLVEWLRDGTRFASVVHGTEARSEWVLETDLASIFVDARDGVAQPETEIAISFRLLDAQRSATSIRFEKRYEATERAADRTPAAIAAAFSRALGRVLVELAADLDVAIAAKR